MTLPPLSSPPLGLFKPDTVEGGWVLYKAFEFTKLWFQKVACKTTLLCSVQVFPIHMILHPLKKTSCFCCLPPRTATWTSYNHCYRPGRSDLPFTSLNPDDQQHRFHVESRFDILSSDRFHLQSKCLVWRRRKTPLGASPRKQHSIFFSYLEVFKLLFSTWLFFWFLNEWNI